MAKEMMTNKKKKKTRTESQKYLQNSAPHLHSLRSQ